MKNIFRSLSLLIALSLLILSVSSCATGADDTAVRVIALKGPTGMGMAKLMRDNDVGESENEYAFTVSSAPTDVTSEVLAGRVDIAAVPINLAATLYNKGADISVIAVNTLGVLYIAENGNTVNSVSDLRGKTVYAMGKGATPEYIFDRLLTINGIDPDNDVNIIYCSDGAEVASYLVAGKAGIGLIPEPNLTAALMSSESLRIALSINDEWNNVSSTPIVQGVLIATDSFIGDHPAKVGSFLKEYAASTGYVVNNIDDASQIIENYGITPKAVIAKRSIPNCNICCFTGDEMIPLVNDMLKVLFDADPSSIGGKMPGDDLYYIP